MDFLPTKNLITTQHYFSIEESSSSNSKDNLLKGYIPSNTALEINIHEELIFVEKWSCIILLFHIDET